MNLTVSDAVIKFDRVSKRYRMRYALNDVSFELPRGQVIGLIGANGSGKSTTLKLMAGLIHPTDGQVHVFGKPATRRVGSHISYMSDADALYGFYTAAEMMDFYQTMFSDFNLAKAHEMLDFMNLEPNRLIRELSKGNLGRLKLVLALSRQAPLILMDEPLSGLDPLVRQQILKGLISFIDLEEQTVLMSTHEVAEVEPLLDTVVLMSEGQVVDIQGVDQIRTEHHSVLVDWMTERLLQHR